jgi:hypothetical protein
MIIIIMVIIIITKKMVIVVIAILIVISCLVRSRPDNGAMDARNHQNAWKEMIMFSRLRLSMHNVVGSVVEVCILWPDLDVIIVSDWVLLHVIRITHTRGKL